MWDRHLSLSTCSLSRAHLTGVCPSRRILAIVLRRERLRLARRRYERVLNSPFSVTSLEPYPVLPYPSQRTLKIWLASCCWHSSRPCGRHPAIRKTSDRVPASLP